MSAPAPAAPRCPLDLWHASGAPRRRLALGALAGRSDAADGPVDLAIVAPGRHEAGRVWLERAIATAGSRIDADGLVWVLVDRRRRGVARRALERAGLAMLDPVLCVPRWPATVHLVALAPGPVGDAGRRHLGMARRSAALAAALASSPSGRSLLRRVAPGCALVAGGPAAVPLAWLGASAAAASGGAREDARVAVVLRFPADAAAPDLVVKVPLDAAGLGRVQAERAALEALGPAAAAAGAAVPVPRPAPAPAGLATHPLTGRGAGALLHRDPGRVDAVTAAVAAWLLAWNHATRRPAEAPAELLERRLVEPAARLGVPAGYRDALGDLARRLARAPVVTVAAHGDLTTFNVLLGANGIGIVDWEAAEAAALPLTDLWYLLADAVARARRIPHAAAVTALAEGGAPAVAAHAAALDLSADQAAAGFHACWLAHADDERRRGTAGPFCDVVGAVGARPALWPPGAP